MCLWTATYVKKVEAEKFDGTRHRTLGDVNLKLKVEAKRNVMKKSKKANGDQGGNRLHDGCGITMRPYEGWLQYDGTTRTGEAMEQVTFST